MAPPHRLLWRGTLSHPHAPLDGIAFVAHLPSSMSPTISTFASPSLFNPASALSPLALALETLRGRPELPILGIWHGEVDVEEGIRMYINPASSFSIAYFTRLFCATLPSSADTAHTCLRISIGDSPGNPEELLLLASPAPSSPSMLQILIGRKRAIPLKARARLPRPDDPLPRPIRDLKALLREPPHQAPAGQRGTKRPQSTANTPTTELPNPLEANPFLAPPAKRRRANTSTSGPSSALPSIPERPALPRRKSSKGVLRNKENPSSKAAAQTPAPYAALGPPAVPVPSTHPPTLEESNKATIKKQILASLSAVGCPRSHSEFKDCFTTINRGVVFALRKHLKTRKAEREEVVRLVGMHVGMYFVPPEP